MKQTLNKIPLITLPSKAKQAGKATRTLHIVAMAVGQRLPSDSTIDLSEANALPSLCLRHTEKIHIMKHFCSEGGPMGSFRGLSGSKLGEV